MAEKEISDKKEVGNISTEISPEKEEIVSSPFLPLYTKSESITSLDWTTFEYTWRINQLQRFRNCYNNLELRSPSFPKTGQYAIQADLCNDEITVTLRILNSESFIGSCTTTLRNDDGYLSSDFISRRISDKTLLTKISDYFFDSIKIHCKIEIYRNIIDSTIHMKLPSSLQSEYLNFLNYSNLDEIESKYGKSIKFIVDEKNHYVITRKLLLATNSKYFKNICLTYEAKEKDMTNELSTSREKSIFQDILLFIINGIELGRKLIESRYYSYPTTLLIAAYKYDVLALKWMCEHYLLRRITIENAVELIQLAFLSEATFLETHVATFIKFHIKEIMDTADFQNIQKDSNNIKICELIEKIKISEIISTNPIISPK